MSIIEAQGLSKRYGRVEALTDLNLSLEKGQIVGLLGPNGSGKTTLIKLINGLLTPSEGQILIEGKGLFVACQNGELLEVRELQVAGKKRLSARDFLNGNQAVKKLK